MPLGPRHSEGKPCPVGASGAAPPRSLGGGGNSRACGGLWGPRMHSAPLGDTNVVRAAGGTEQAQRPPDGTLAPEAATEGHPSGVCRRRAGVSPTGPQSGRTQRGLSQLAVGAGPRASLRWLVIASGPGARRLVDTQGRAGPGGQRGRRAAVCGSIWKFGLRAAPLRSAGHARAMQGTRGHMGHGGSCHRAEGRQAGVRVLETRRLGLSCALGVTAARHPGCWELECPPKA